MQSTTKIAGAFWIGLASAVLSGTTAAATLPPRGSFIYSNACADEGGDWNGFLVRFSRGAGGVRVVIEFNDEGPDSGPVTARNVVFDAASGKLRFTYIGGVSNSRHRFSGEISKEWLKGRFDSSNQSLPAKKREPKTLSDC